MANTDFDPTTPLVGAREYIAQVMAQHPELCTNGLGFSYQHFTKVENKAEFLKHREEMLSERSCREFAAAVAWLKQATRRKNLNWRCSSYGLKAVVERWAGDHVGKYVSNGAFIAAAFHLGYKTGRAEDSPNVCLNLSTKVLP